MLTPESDVYFRLPGETNQRVLHAARVVMARESGCTAELDEQGLRIQAGQEMLIYYQRGSEFLQRPIVVDAIMQRSPTVIGFRLVGEPVSAQSRQCFRIGTVVAGLTVAVGDERACPVNDVSATGFSFLSSRDHQIGARLRVAILHEGVTYTGLACVQSVRKLQRTKTRYGMFCVSGRGAEGNLEEGLGRVCMAVQRAQARRRAGA